MSEDITIPPDVLSAMEQINAEVERRLTTMTDVALLYVLKECGQVRMAMLDAIGELVDNPDTKIVKPGDDIGGMIRSATMQSFMAECALRLILTTWQERQDRKNHVDDD